ncbi:MAG: efflux transporter periplasmic adaptor subunit [Desulfovibrionaceae bacterium CG1_02_65_16]|nr:MAG: efflux transporter periplasmic adaptor subunit [Desulfovibrionaceae bacterium CG1_02_65_16]
MRTRTKVTTLFLLAALFAAVSGCGQNKQAAQQAGEPEVTVVSINPQKLTLTTVLAGRTSAHLMSDVRPQVGGIIQKRLFKEGSDVKAGQQLYQIDPATYQAAYANARATLSKAEANAQPARLKAERYGNLVKVNGVSRQDNDDAQAAYQQAQAEVISAKAALDTARINLNYTRVNAPISGRIGKSTVTPGALVTASQATALATIQQIDPIYVDVTQSSAEVMRLKRDLASGKLKKAGADGAKVKLLFEDGTAYDQDGVLQFSDITVDQTTGVITLRALFPNTGHVILPGLYVRAVLEEGVNDQALLVPQAAVSRDTKGAAQVMVVKPDNIVEVRPISVDRVVGDKWLVTAGLTAGERVIVEGLQKVRPGAKVKAIETTAPAAQPDQQNNATAPQAAAQAAPATVPAAAPAAKAEAKPKAEPAKTKAEAPKAKESAKAEPAAKAPAKAPAEKTAQTSVSSPVTGAATKAVTHAETKATTTAVTKATTKAEMKTPDAAKHDKGSAYSPPKDQPWPSSSLDGHAPENSTKHN